MLKAILGLTMFLGMSQVALADDGGVVGIKAGEIKFGTSKYDNQAQQYKFTQVAVDENSGSYEIDFNGKESAKLMTTLPPFLTVMTGEYKNFPKWVAQYKANNRGLEVTGGNGQPTVLISCVGGEYDYNGTNEDHPPKFTPYADGAHCAVTVQSWGDDDVEYSYDPKKLVCGGN